MAATRPVQQKCRSSLALFCRRLKEFDLTNGLQRQSHHVDPFPTHYGRPDPVAVCRCFPHQTTVHQSRATHLHPRQSQLACSLVGRVPAAPADSCSFQKPPDGWKSSRDPPGGGTEVGDKVGKLKGDKATADPKVLAHAFLPLPAHAC
jgi:hypothetical protein